MREKTEVLCRRISNNLCGYSVLREYLYCYLKTAFQRVQYGNREEEVTLQWRILTNGIKPCDRINSDKPCRQYMFCMWVDENSTLSLWTVFSKPVNLLIFALVLPLSGYIWDHMYVFFTDWPLLCSNMNLRCMLIF